VPRPDTERLAFCGVCRHPELSDASAAQGFVLKHTAFGLAVLVSTWLVPVAPAQPVLYITDSGDKTIKRIDPGGIVSTVARGFISPQGITQDPSGNLYVVDNGSILKGLPNGGFTTYATGLTGATGLALGADHSSLFTISSQGVFRVAPDGTVSPFYTPVGSFPNGGGIGVDSGGNVYISSLLSITKITPTGVASTFYSTVSDTVTTHGVYVAPNDNVFFNEIVETGAGISFINSLRPDGTLVSTTRGSGLVNGISVANDPQDHNIYIAEHGLNVPQHAVRYALQGSSTGFSVYASNGLVSPNYMVTAVPEPSSLIICGMTIMGAVTM
jgi:hypothetical protein